MTLLLEIPFFAGLLASTIHVLAGPDHLAAVTPLAIESKKRSWSVGAFWGIGHLIGMLLIGGIFTIFKEFIPVEKISSHSEQLVGIVLIGIGIWAIWRIFYHDHNHKHPHYHEDEEAFIHVHNHDHTSTDIHTHKHSEKVKRARITALSIGILHGLAGVSHFLLMLPTLSFGSTAESVFYLSGFGIGTVVAMTTFALVLGYVSHKSHTAGHNDLLFKGIRFAGGLFAIIIGVYWMFLSV